MNPNPNPSAGWGDVSLHPTTARMLRENARAYGDEVALREKDFGIWRPVCWRDYHDRVRALALYFAAEGLAPGDVVALVGNNGPYWVFGALAAHANRAMSLGVYGDVLAPELAHQLERTGAKIAVVEDEEQVDKFLELGDKADGVRRIIYKDARGMRKRRDPRLISLKDALAQGALLAAREPARFDEMTDATRGDDSALLISTSGTTAHPKFAEITNEAFLRHTARYLERDPKGAEDEYVSALPLPWVMETKYALGKSLVCRMRINFVESPETLMEDLREIGPTFILLGPRAWEQIAGTTRARMLESSPLKRALFNLGARVGARAAESGRMSRLADFLVFRALRDSLGFSRLRSAATGGASLGPDTYKFFIAMGVPLKQLYGQTELIGAYTSHSAEDVDFETSGPPFEGVEVRVADPDDEGLGKIMTRHPNMMRGYYRDPEETAKAMRDGWMETGDAGYFKEGHLVVVDRFSDLARTAGGARFSPQHLENKLKFSPFIAEAVAIGDGREFLTALLCLRFAVASKWAERRRVAFTNYADLSAREEMRELIRAEVARVNESLLPANRIRRFVLLYKELDADDGELTRTKKVRRHVVEERYAGIISALYSDADSVKVDDRVTLQDGSTQRVSAELAVEKLF